MVLRKVTPAVRFIFAMWRSDGSATLRRLAPSQRIFANIAHARSVDLIIILQKKKIKFADSKNSSIFAIQNEM